MGAAFTPWWLGGWSYDLDIMPNGLAEVAFDSGLGTCNVHICQRYIDGPTLVNGYRVPKGDWTYGYTASDGTELNTYGRRPYAWRPVPVPPPPSEGKWPTEAKANLAAERFLASYCNEHIREYVARLVGAAPAMCAALEPFAKLELPPRAEGNAGLWSILHAEILAAREALALAALTTPTGAPK